MRNIYFFRIIVLFFSAMILASCAGGGSGSDSDGDGSLSISTGSIEIRAEQYGERPSNKSISYSSSNSDVYEVLVGPPAGSSDPDWINYDFSQYSDSIVIGVNSTNLSPGKYTTTVRIATGDARGYLIDYKDIDVEYVVEKQMLISANKEALSFSATEGNASLSQLIELDINTESMPSWTASIEYIGGVSDWLEITPDFSENTIQVAAKAFGAGTYLANINVSYTTLGGSKTLQIPVVYEVASIAEISDSSLSFSVVEGETPESRDISISFGENNLHWAASVNYISGNDWLEITQNQGIISIKPLAQLAGNYQANIQIQYSLNGYSSTITIPVAYDAASGISLSATEFLINAVEGNDPPSQTLDISYEGSGEITAWETDIRYSRIGREWLDVEIKSISDTQASIDIDARPIANGEYTAFIDIKYNLGELIGQKTVKVKYSVSEGIILTDDNLSFEQFEGLDSEAQDIAITYQGSGELVNWSLYTDYLTNNGDNWLNITFEEGQSFPIILGVKPIQMPEGTYRAKVIFRYTFSDINGYETKEFLVEYKVTYLDSYVSSISPYVRYKGRQSKVILRGKGFNGLSSESVTFNGVPVESANIVSDTEMHVIPALSVFNEAGIYHVEIDGSSLVKLSGPNLIVVEPDSYDPVMLSLAGFVKQLIYDAERKAIFYTTSVNSAVHKMTYTSGGGWNHTSYDMTYGASGVNLSIDGSSLAVTTDSDLHFFDPDTLTLNEKISIGSASHDNYVAVAPMNNGKTLLLDNNGWADVMSYPEKERINSGLNSVYDANAILSADRDIFICAGEKYDPVYRYDASDSSITSVISKLHIDFDRELSGISGHAERTVIGLNVYDASFVKLGSLDMESEPSALTVSPDGTKVYAVTNNLLSIYDISGDAGPFPQEGESTAFTQNVDFRAGGIVASEDGETLFVYSGSTLYVYPAP